jgi:hypothetical protein
MANASTECKTDIHVLVEMLAVILTMVDTIQVIILAIILVTAAAILTMVAAVVTTILSTTILTKTTAVTSSGDHFTTTLVVINTVINPVINLMTDPATRFFAGSSLS